MSAHPTWMAEYDYRRPSGALETLRVSYGPIGRFPASCPDRPNAKSRNRIVEVPSYQTRVMADASRLAGSVGVGNLVLSDADGALAYLRDCSPVELRLWRGVPGTPLATWDRLVTSRPPVPRFDLTGSRPGRVTIPLFDLRSELEDLIQTHNYAGTSNGTGTGYEGDSSMKDQPVPLGLGDLTGAHVPAVWANAQDRVAQLNDGAMGAVSGVYDRGGAAGLGFLGDMSNAFFDAASLSSTQYAGNGGRGLVKLGGALGGQITFGFHGMTAAGETAPEVLRWLLARRGHSIGAELAALSSAAKVGLWVQGGSYRAAWEPLLASERIWALPDALGVWRGGRIGLPVGAPVLALTDRSALEIGIWDATLAVPAARVEVKWGRRYKTFTRSDMASSLWGTPAEADLGQEWRTAAWPDQATSDAVRAKWPGARTVTIETALRAEAPAQTLAQDLYTLLGPRGDGTPPKPIRVVTELTAATLALRHMDEVHLDWPAAGIAQDFALWGIRPCSPREHLIELELFA